MGESAKITLVWDGKERRTFNGPQQSIGLANFIQENIRPIVREWEIFAETLKPASNDMTPRALRNHIHQILEFIINDIRSSQTRAEQVRKSHGEKEKGPAPSAAETHAALRLAGGFDIDQMVSEWRALRASVVKLWSASNIKMTNADVIDLTRFNESIDQELAESVSHYTKKSNFSKDLFMGVLGHDIGAPLNAISMCAQLLLNIGSIGMPQTLSEGQRMLASQIFESASRISKIVSDLLEAARARFGAGLPIIRSPMDMAFIGRKLVDEMRVAHPKHSILFAISGDAKGEWDKARIGQVFSNLIGNALQYGFKDTPINVTVKGMAEEVILSVHNEGVPISPEKIETLFDSFHRAVTTEEEADPTQINLGLGLYITKDIIVSHGGTIGVTSSEENGTTFTARFPRIHKGEVGLIGMVKNLLQ